MRRVNFAAKLLSDTSLPGIKSIVAGLKERGNLSPAEFIRACLDLVGPVEVDEGTFEELLSHAREGGDVSWDTEEGATESERRTGVMLAMIAATREFQFA